MEKSVTSIKELVVQTLSNGSEIKANAVKGDAFACFQMGMIHLLGIDTPIDFEKASKYFGNQSLSDDPDTNRLLGFIAECEGNYSQAFKYYAKASGSTGNNAKKPYNNKVFSERNNLQSYFKKLDLSGSALNKIVTNVLNEYIKGGATKVEASIRIALMCDDADSCVVAAEALCDSGDYFSAMSWLQRANIPETTSLYASLKKKISDLKSALNLPNTLEVVEIDGDSFLGNVDTTPSYAVIKQLCDEMAASCKKEWGNTVSPKIAVIKKQVEDEEAARLKRQRDEEAARLKRQREEEAERLKRQREEEAARLKRQRDEEAARLKRQREEEIRKKKKKTTLIVDMILLTIFVPWGFLWLILMVVGIIGSTSNTYSVIENIVYLSIFLFAIVLFPYGIVKLLSVLIINRIFK